MSMSRLFCLLLVGFIGSAWCTPVDGQTAGSLEPRVAARKGAFRDDEVQGIVVGAHLASSNRIVIVTRRPAEVREYDRAGTLLGVRSQPGGGPGGLNDASWSQLTNDTLWVYDPAQRRLSWYSVTPWGARGSLPLEQPDDPRFAGRIRVIGRLAGGHIVVRSSATDEPPRIDGLWRRTEYLAVRGPGPTPRWVALAKELSSTDVIRVPPRSPSLPATAVHTLSRNSFVCVLGSSIVVARNDLSTADLLGPDGAVVAQLSLQVPSSVLDATTLQESARRLIRDSESSADTLILSMRYDRRFIPEVAPYFTEAACDATGRAWFRVFSNDLLAPSDFLVVAFIRGNARVLRLPRGFRFRDSDGATVLGATISRTAGLEVELYSIPD